MNDNNKEDGCLTAIIIISILMIILSGNILLFIWIQEGDYYLSWIEGLWAIFALIADILLPFALIRYNEKKQEEYRKKQEEDRKKQEEDRKKQEEDRKKQEENRKKQEEFEEIMRQYYIVKQNTLELISSDSRKIKLILAKIKKHNDSSALCEKILKLLSFADSREDSKNLLEYFYYIDNERYIESRNQIFGSVINKNNIPNNKATLPQYVKRLEELIKENDKIISDIKKNLYAKTDLEDILIDFKQL